MGRSRLLMLRPRSSADRCMWEVHVTWSPIMAEPCLLLCLCGMLTLILVCLGLHGSYSIRPNPPSKPTACTIWLPILKILRGFELRSLDSESRVRGDATKGTETQQNDFHQISHMTMHDLNLVPEQHPTRSRIRTQTPGKAPQMHGESNERYACHRAA